MATAPQYSKFAAAAENVATDLNRYSDTQDATLRAALGGVAVTNEISPRTLMYAAAGMLRHAQPILILERFAQPHPMPRNKSQTIKFRRPVPLKAATTPLVEGVTPDPQKMSYEDVETSLKQYGSWMGITDVIQDTHEDPVLQNMSMLCGEQAAETKEALLWGTVTGGTNVFYASGAANRNAVKETLGISDLRAVIRFLRKQRAKMITKILNPSVNISTRYVEAGFVAVGHTDLENDLRNLDGFVPVAGYGSRQPLSEYEIGTIENTRFILSPMYEPVIATGGGQTTNAAGDAIMNDGTDQMVYQLVFFSQDCFGTVPLRGRESVQNFVLNPGQARGSDPIGQRGSVGWKTWHASLILNQAWLARLEVAATAL